MLKPALDQKGLRHFPKFVLHVMAIPRVETCPGSKGIATTPGRDFGKDTSHLLKPALDQKGLRQIFFAKQVFNSFSWLKPALDQKGLRLK
jgi:hypothetical protein